MRRILSGWPQQALASLMRHLGVERADPFGYSMGAGTALQMAIRHPELVHKLVLAAPAHRPDSMYPEVVENIRNLKPEEFAGSPWLEAYQQVAPDPDDWPTLLANVTLTERVDRLVPMIAEFLDAPMPE